MIVDSFYVSSYLLYIMIFSLYNHFFSIQSLKIIFSPSFNLQSLPAVYKFKTAIFTFNLEYRFNSNKGLMDLKSSSFTRALEEATHKSKWQDNISEHITPTQHKPNYHQRNLEMTYIPLQHQLYTTLEFKEFIYYFFTHASEARQANERYKTIKTKPEFSLMVYSFKRDDGTHNNIEMTQLKGTPSCIAAGISSHRTEAQSCADNNATQSKYSYKMIVLIGLKEGFMKIVQFNLDKEQKSLKPKLISQKIEQKPIVRILIADKIHFQQKNICFILFQDNKVFIFNYLSRNVICIYQPPILGHDHAVGFALHCSARYFASCSRSGQITFWEINESALKAIAKSEDKVIKQRKRREDAMEEDEVQEEVWSFKAKERVINVFPLSALHSASIYGLKWISFMGNLLALITSTGVFKLISVNFEVKDEYILLIEYQISNGQAITTAQLFPEQETLIVFKSHSFIRQVDSNENNQPKKMTADLTLDELTRRQVMLASKDNYYRFNYNCIQNCTNENNTIEEITFQGDLTIKTVEEYSITAVTEQGDNVVNKDMMKFESGVVSEDRSIAMCRNDKGFFIGLFKELDLNSDTLRQ